MSKRQFREQVRAAPRFPDLMLNQVRAGEGATGRRTGGSEADYRHFKSTGYPLCFPVLFFLYNGLVTPDLRT